ncbi:MAG: UDP-N-acetylmuramoyl-L-alanine--D-glutamate ligase [Oligosphaeraceae bacterium]
MKGLEGLEILVLGAGGSGRAAAQLACAQGARVLVADSAPVDPAPEKSASLQAQGVEFLWGAGGERWQGREISRVVVSPGIPLDSPLHRWGESTGAPLVGELEFGASFLNCPVFAVTGTNGKTTTTELLTECLKDAGWKVRSAGNIGVPVSQVAWEQPELDALVVEVSSFQLEHATSFRARGAILLNVTPDHLDRHGSLERYTALKARLLEQLLPGGVAVYHAALEESLRLSPEIRRVRLWLRGEEPGSAPRPAAEDWQVAADGIRRLTPAEELAVPRYSLRLQGNHNLENVMAVVSLLTALGIPRERYRVALSHFQCGPHRIQTVGEWRGIRFVDDSKATDVDALVQALRTLGPCAGKGISLIAGGLDKGCSLEEAKPDIRMYVKSVFLIGECRHRLQEAWREEAPCVLCDSLEEAVTRAAQGASSGETVLLSPGCASMDMFRSYAERGERFAAAMKALPQEEDTPIPPA